MFASLKNKIREEIGNDVTAVVRNTGTVRGINSKHTSRTGSNSSVSGSQISLDDVREEPSISPLNTLKRENSVDLKLNDGTPLTNKDIKKLESREDEWRKRLQKKEAELMKKMEKRDEEWRIKFFEKERDWKKMTEKLEKEKAKLVEDKLKAEYAKSSLEIALRDAEEYKKKLYSFQEDAEQLEGFQTQEMAKIKHLLLAKEQEVDEKSHLLKSTLNEVETLKAEVSRLRRYEDELNSIQDEMETLRHSTQREKSQLSVQLDQREEEVRHLRDKLFVLEQRVASSNESLTVDDRIADLMRERTLLERKLEEAHVHLSDIKTSWSGKIASLETQVGRLSRQAGEEGAERRRVEEEKAQLKLRVKQLEAEVEVNGVVMATKDAKLLRMAEDIDEMATELKELRASVDDEVAEFSRQIESSEKKIQILKTQLEDTTSRITSLTTELSHLRLSYEGEKSNNASMQSEVARLRENLESERTSCATLRVCLEKERDEKDSALMRIALVSQDLQIAKQSNGRLEEENIELQNRMDNLEKLLKNKTNDAEDCYRKLEETRRRIQELEESEKNKERLEGNEKVLRNSLTDLEEQLNEKTKIIKVLQQRLTDMKKTLQKELRVPSSSIDSDPEQSAAIINPSSSKTVTGKGRGAKDDDVNFKYLKHVLIKFLTSREYEALHLTRAVATLLHFSPEEERLLQETLEWKMSWFGTRPNLGIGQTAKAIPPS